MTSSRGSTAELTITSSSRTTGETQVAFARGRTDGGPAARPGRPHPRAAVRDGQDRQLQELIPICSYCKKVADDRNYWQQVESYISTRTGAQFSHGVCPQCYAKVIAQLEKAGATADT